jgi:hypothetical protein
MQHPLAYLIACTTLMAAAAPAHAEATVFVKPQAAYVDGAGVMPKIKEECGLEASIPSHLFRNLSRAEPGAALLSEGAAVGSTPVISVNILSVSGIGGGAWTGYKGISIRAQLTEKGKVVRSIDLHRTTSGGMFAGFKGTCSILDRAATALGKDVFNWYAHPDTARSTFESGTPEPAASAASQ